MTADEPRPAPSAASLPDRPEWLRWTFTKGKTVLSIRAPQGTPMVMEQAGWKVEYAQSLAPAPQPEPLRAALERLVQTVQRDAGTFPWNLDIEDALDAARAALQASPQSESRAIELLRELVEALYWEDQGDEGFWPLIDKPYERFAEAAIAARTFLRDTAAPPDHAYEGQIYRSDSRCEHPGCGIVYWKHKAAAPPEKPDEQ